jgi:chromodomain-helicase-DNA-binding protein 7
MVVSDLGHIVTDRPGFHTDSYIYPAGFKSSRLYFSVLNPSERIWYTSEIVDTGAELPLFRVTMNDHPEIFFEGNSPSSPWYHIVKHVMEAGGGESDTVRLTGRRCIGLSFPVIRYLIQGMKGAEKCVNYVMQRFEQSGV